jgi:hypothetical protein
MDGLDRFLIIVMFFGLLIFNVVSWYKIESIEIKVNSNHEIERRNLYQVYKDRQAITVWTNYCIVNDTVTNMVCVYTNHF